MFCVLKARQLATRQLEVILCTVFYYSCTGSMKVKQTWSTQYTMKEYLGEDNVSHGISARSLERQPVRTQRKLQYGVLWRRGSNEERHPKLMRTSFHPTWLSLHCSECGSVFCNMRSLMRLTVLFYRGCFRRIFAGSPLFQ